MGEHNSYATEEISALCDGGHVPTILMLVSVDVTGHVPTPLVSFYKQRTYQLPSYPQRVRRFYLVAPHK